MANWKVLIPVAAAAVFASTAAFAAAQNYPAKGFTYVGEPNNWHAPKNAKKVMDPSSGVMAAPNHPSHGTSTYLNEASWNYKATKKVMDPSSGVMAPPNHPSHGTSTVMGER